MSQMSQTQRVSGATRAPRGHRHLGAGRAVWQSWACLVGRGYC